MAASKKDFFKPGRAGQQAKAELTNSASRQIQDAEDAARQKKTDRLRALRLAQPVAAPAETGGKKKKGP